jgi:multisubunit Na+/H+ antiporter MnhB subunit
MDPNLVIPFVVMAAPVAIVLIVLRYRHLQTQERYRMLLQLADKGVELPTQLLTEPHVVYSERRRALVLIGCGIGLMLMMLALPGAFDDGTSVHSLWGLGLLPLMIGLGYLASWWLNRRGELRG